MAGIIFADGFYHYDTADMLEKKWGFAYNKGAISIGTENPRIAGRKYLQISGTGYVWRINKVSVPTKATIAFGFRLNFFNNTGSYRPFLIVTNEDNSKNFTLCYLDSTGELFILPQGSSTGKIATGFYLTAENWCHLELVMDITAGTFSVYFNSSEKVITYPSFTGFVGFKKITLTNDLPTVRFSDFRMSDDAVSLGDTEVVTLYPNGAGSYSQMTPSEAKANWECVSEENADETDYVEGADITNDFYTFSNVDSGGTIHAVQVTALMRKDNPGKMSGSLFAKTPEDVGVGIRSVVSDESKFYRGVHLSMPNEEPWSESGLNNMEFGVLATVL